MRVVCRRTGLRPELIRSWERNYDAIAPVRSAGGHRLYAEKDIERLQLLRHATEAGHPIGRISGVDDDSLRKLIAADARDRPLPASTFATGGDIHVAACLEAASQLDRSGLEQAVERAELELGRVAMVEEVLAPLVQAMGEATRTGALRPMHEHLLSSVLVASSQGFRNAFAQAASAPRLIVTTPARQHHELGAILAANVAAGEGWQVTYLGANLPAEEIAAAVLLKKAAALALSVAYPPDDPLLAGELLRLRRHLGPAIAILVGGRAAASYQSALKETNCFLASDFNAFRSLLSKLRFEGAAATSTCGHKYGYVSSDEAPRQQGA